MVPFFFSCYNFLMKSQDLKKIDLPDSPGVYKLLSKGQILYIGKATSLKDRVASYFAKDLINTRGSPYCRYGF